MTNARTLVLILVSVGASAATAGSPLVTPFDPVAAFEASETRRIQAHLEGAQALLASRELSSLTPAQRTARSRNVARLQAYKEAGRFPKNLDFPAQAVPYFRDAEGTLCAMAYLIAESGATDMVERVVAMRNNATVHELADEPGLAAWLETNGLTLEEAARIQPSYFAYDMKWIDPPPVALEAGACSRPFAAEVTDPYSRAFLTGPVAVRTTSQSTRFFADPDCREPLLTVDDHPTVQFVAGFARFFMQQTVAGEEWVWFDLPGSLYAELTILPGPATGVRLVTPPTWTGTINEQPTVIVEATDSFGNASASTEALITTTQLGGDPVDATFGTGSSLVDGGDVRQGQLTWSERGRAELHIRARSAGLVTTQLSSGAHVFPSTVLTFTAVEEPAEPAEPAEPSEPIQPGEFTGSPVEAHETRLEQTAGCAALPAGSLGGGILLLAIALRRRSRV